MRIEDLRPLTAIGAFDVGVLIRLVRLNVARIGQRGDHGGVSPAQRDWSLSGFLVLRPAGRRNKGPARSTTQCESINAGRHED